MNTTLDITFGKYDIPAKGTVITLAAEGPEYPHSVDHLNETIDGQITNAASVVDFKGKKKTHIALLAPGDGKIARLLVIGIGDTSKYSSDDWINLGGQIYSKLGKNDKTISLVIDDIINEDEVGPKQIAEIALGLSLRSYRFDVYKKSSSDEDEDKKNKGPSKVSILSSDAAKARKAYASLKVIGEGVCVARDLVNEPPNILYPEEFAKRAKQLEELGVEVKLLNQKALAKENMNALLAVGQGSERESYLAVMKWNGGAKKTDAPVAFVGKGVTFDTGGISLKPGAGMQDMKGDMAGAACVTGLMHALAARKAKVNAVGIIGLVENMPSSNAYRPGDILTSKSGQTIEIQNTDAEGRLVLADALTYCQKHHKPKFLINLATLTGAILVALGHEHAGLFSNNDELSKQLSEVGVKTSEKVWRLPLGPKYDKLLESKFADMKNIGGRYAGSITAAQFLQRFIEDNTPWVHLDIAGTGMSSPTTDINTSWGSGYGVRLLNQLVADYYEG